MQFKGPPKYLERLSMKHAFFSVLKFILMAIAIAFIAIILFKVIIGLALITVTFAFWGLGIVGLILIVWGLITLKKKF